jgi:ribosomal-protein-alanine N-acetyltransferase
MSEYRIRESVPFDLASILQIERSNASAAHWSETSYADLWNNLQPTRVCFVAENEGVSLGFVVGREIAGEWELENIAVVPEYKRQGIGHALLQRLLAVASATGGERLLLEVRDSNHAARKLYESQGFVISGRRKGYYRDPVEDALLYEKKFASGSIKIR